MQWLSEGASQAESRYAPVSDIGLNTLLSQLGETLVRQSQDGIGADLADVPGMWHVAEMVPPAAALAPVIPTEVFLLALSLCGQALVSEPKVVLPRAKI
eukprot:6086156-Amphidinium_carterae.1